MSLRSILRSAAAAVCVSLVAVASLVQPAQAASSVTVTSSLGTGRASADGGTTITVTGRGFQSIQNGFGGVYVFFGWVSDPSGGSWKPSNGGRTGAEMLYVPDSEARDNQGFQRFVTFPGSSTAATANGGEVSADGSFSFQMVVPGPRFTAIDRDGNSAEIDCTQVGCGVITVGAHGVVNANNETFTPVQFVGAGTSSNQSQGAAEAPAQQQPAAGQQAGGSGVPARPNTEGAAGTPGDAAPAVDGEEALEGVDGGALVGAEPVVVPDQPATVGLSQKAVQVGRVLGFTGQNFVPGEQVVATLGSGEAGAGPLTAGRFGEVAGAVTLPMGMRAGTHVLKLVGAGSGQVAEAEVSVMADPASLNNAAAVEDGGEAWDWAWIAVFAAAAFLLVLLVFTFVSAILKRRAGKQKPGMKRVRVRKGTQPPAGGAGGATPGADDTQVLGTVR